METTSRENTGAPSQTTSFETVVGNGGELDQIAGADSEVLTTQQGIPVAEGQNHLKIGERGPAFFEDFRFHEKIFYFDHERIPERVVHARGFGAHGAFTLTESLGGLTTAKVRSEVGEQTPMFVRFSTVAQGARRGGALLSVRSAEGQQAEADAMLDHIRSVDASARGNAYRETGWDRFDEAVPAYDRDEIARDRALYANETTRV